MGPPDGPARLADQLGFLLEVDRLKSVLRRGYVADGSRRENTAEHSWTLALMAIVLAEHATEPVDVARVVRMVVIHDLVEVDAGDTYVYDEAARASKDERERAAADRLYGLLPAGQGAELRALWDEFEHGVTADRVHAVNEEIDRGSPTLWAEVQRRLADALERGWIDPGPAGPGAAAGGEVGAAGAAGTAPTPGQV